MMTSGKNLFFGERSGWSEEGDEVEVGEAVEVDEEEEVVLGEEVEEAELLVMIFDSGTADEDGAAEVEGGGVEEADEAGVLLAVADERSVLPVALALALALGEAVFPAEAAAARIEDGIAFPPPPPPLAFGASPLSSSPPPPPPKILGLKFSCLFLGSGWTVHCNPPVPSPPPGKYFPAKL